MSADPAAIPFSADTLYFGAAFAIDQRCHTVDNRDVASACAAAATADVTPAEKARFHTALVAFSQKSQKGVVKPETVGEWRKRAANAMADGRVTPDEMRGLTMWPETEGAAPPPTPAK